MRVRVREKKKPLALTKSVRACPSSTRCARFSPALPPRSSRALSLSRRRKTCTNSSLALNLSRKRALKSASRNRASTASRRADSGRRIRVGAVNDMRVDAWSRWMSSSFRDDENATKEVCFSRARTMGSSSSCSICVGVWWRAARSRRSYFTARVFGDKKKSSFSSVIFCEEERERRLFAN